MNKFRKLKKGDYVTIMGKRWFDKTYGNTYCSVQIYINHDHIVTLPFTYGYGSYYEQIAHEFLYKHGFISSTNRYEQEQKGIKFLVAVNDGLKRELDKKAFYKFEVKNAK